MLLEDFDPFSYDTPPIRTISEAAKYICTSPILSPIKMLGHSFEISTFPV